MPMLMACTVKNITLENLHHNPIHAPTPTTREMADPDLLQQPPSIDEASRDPVSSKDSQAG